MPAREHSKYIMVKNLDAARKVLLKEGQNLAEKGLLISAQDIFHLTYKEVWDAIDLDLNMKAIVEHRKTLFSHYQKLTP